MAKAGKVRALDALKRALGDYWENWERFKAHPTLDRFLSDTEQKAVEAYKSAEGMDINHVLRSSDRYKGTHWGDLYTPTVESIDSALDKSSLVRPLDLFRGLSGKYPGQLLNAPQGLVDPGYGSWSVRSGSARDAAGGDETVNGLINTDADLSSPLVLFSRLEKGERALPIRGNKADEAYEGEVLAPRNSRTQIISDPFEYDGSVWAQATVRPNYAEGGQVGDKERRNALDALSKAAALPNTLMPGMKPREKQLFLRGLLSQLYGLNDAGDPEFLGGSEWHNWPGIVDEVVALPTILPDRFVPEASKSAAQRLEALNARMHQDMGIDPAEGFTENLYDAAGVMAGQIPTGAAKTAARAPGLMKKAGRTIKDAAEWFTPTVEATPKNYIIGAGTGAALNTLGESASEPDKAGVNVISKYAEGGNVADDIGSMKRRYSNRSGTDRALKAIKSAISAIESGDRPSAVSLLRPHKDNGVVARVLQELGDQD